MIKLITIYTNYEGSREYRSVLCNKIVFDLLQIKPF